MAKTLFDFDILTRLPHSVLDQVVNRARALIGFSRGVDNTVESEDNYDWMLEGIMRELQSRGLYENLPLKVVRDFKEYKEHFMLCAPSMDKWLRSLVPADTDRSTLLALSRLAAECLAVIIETKWHTPIGLKLMLRHYAKMPDMIEECFPTYCRNQWVPILLKGRRRER